MYQIVISVDTDKKMAIISKENVPDDAFVLDIIKALNAVSAGLRKTLSVYHALAKYDMPTEDEILNTKFSDIIYSHAHTTETI